MKFGYMVEHYSKKIQNVIQTELFKAKSSIKIVMAWQKYHRTGTRESEAGGDWYLKGYDEEL